MNVRRRIKKSPAYFSVTSDQTVHLARKCDLGPRATQGRSTDVARGGGDVIRSRGTRKCNFRLTLALQARTGRASSIVMISCLWAPGVWTVAILPPSGNAKGGLRRNIEWMQTEVICLCYLLPSSVNLKLRCHMPIDPCNRNNLAYITAWNDSCAPRFVWA